MRSVVGKKNTCREDGVLHISLAIFHICLESLRVLEGRGSNHHFPFYPHRMLSVKLIGSPQRPYVELTRSDKPRWEDMVRTLWRHRDMNRNIHTIYILIFRF